MRLGFTLEEAAEVERYNDTVADLQRQWQGLWRTVAIEAAPEMAKAVQTFNDALKDPDVQAALEDTLTLLQAIAGTFPILAQNAVGFTKGMAATSGFLSPFKGLMAQAKEANEASEQMKAFEKQMTDMFNPFGKGKDEKAPMLTGDDLDELLPAPTPEWVEQWNRAEDALKGTSAALDEIAEARAVYDREEREKREMAQSEAAFDKMIKSEEDKLADANAQWEKFTSSSSVGKAMEAAGKAWEQAKTPEEKYIDTIKELIEWQDLGALSAEQFARLKANAADELAKDMKVGKIIAAEEGVAFGSAEAIRGARMQWDIPKNRQVEMQELDNRAKEQREQEKLQLNLPELQVLAEKSEEQTDVMKEVAMNTAAMAQAPQLVRIVERL
jgi:hypothetical protein